MNAKLRVLILEDRPTDTELILRELRRTGYETEWKRVETEADYLAQLDQGWEIILADYNLPQFTGLRALELLMKRGLDIPFILVSGTIGEDKAVAAMKAGANDYVMKEKLARLGAAVEREIRNASERRERRVAEESMRASELRYRRLFESAKDGILILDAETGMVVDVNPFLITLLGLSRDTFLGKRIWELGPLKDVVANQDKFAELQEKEYVCYEDKPLETLDGRRIDVEFVSNVYLVNGSKVIQCNIRDVSARRLAERATRESETRYRRLVEGAPDIVYTFSNRRGGVYYSSRVEQVLGHSAEYLCAHPRWWNESIHPDDRPRIAEAIRDFEQGKPFDIEYRIHDAQGNWLWLQDRPIGRIDGDDEVLFEGIATDISARKRAEGALQASEQEFRDLAESMPQIVWVTRADGWNIYFNQQWVDYTGLRLEQSYGHGWNSPFHPDDKQRAWDAWQHATQHNDVYSVECRLRRADGAYRWWLIRGVPMRNATGEILKWFGTCTDIEDIKQAEMEREKLQAQLTHAQKMESVGRLAGGVAHDFNNLLMGIMGYTQLCLDKVGPDHPVREYLEEIMIGTERSAKLTHQLLAFARKQVIAPKVLDVNEAIEGMLKLLRRLIGEDVAVKWLPGPGSWPVKMDPIQIDQILANLSVNARDAIGGVGSITLETGNAIFDHAYCADHPGSVPGDYVLLAVSDTGRGMDRETLSHIFEPFFTTKGEGEGTGLGLATVYGIVKQNDGFINVCSDPGKGTTFKIYLPRFVTSEAAQVAAQTPAALPSGNETILLVEDEKSIRITTQIFLEDLGYTVLVAENPAKALRLAAEHPGEIHQLITDVIMPGMSGRDLANRLLELRPTIKCLFISGFTADIIAQRGILDDGVNFLSKPFGREQLARKVRELLEGKQG